MTKVTKIYLSQISEGRWIKEGRNSREDKFFWWCFLRYVIYRSSHHFRYNFFFYNDSYHEIVRPLRKPIQVTMVRISSCGSLYFWSYTLWKIGFVASPETSQKHVFWVKCHNFFITDPNLVRQFFLVIVQSIVCCVIFLDRFNKYSVRGTLYKVAL